MKEAPVATAPQLRKSEDTKKTGVDVPAPQSVKYLRRRLARSIEQGDDEHATIIRKLLDLVLNGRHPRHHRFGHLAIPL